MDRQRKRPKEPGRPSPRVRQADMASDALAGALRSTATLGGNQGASQVLERAAALRDRLLDFAADRVRQIHEMWRAEHAALHHRDRWYKAVFKGADHLPEPARWKETARRYRDAITALCQGRLDRGARLIREAVALEREAFATLPAYVADRLPQGLSPPTEPPPESAAIPTGSRSPACPPPPERVLADLVASDPTEVARVGSPRRPRHRWWTEQEAGEDAEPAEGA